MRDIDIKVSVDEDLDEVEEVEEGDEASTDNYFYNKIPLIGKIAYVVFSLTILLLPLFILPSSWGIQMEITKKFLFSGGVLLAFALWLITKLEDGNIKFPGGAIFWASLLLVVSFLFSSLLSPAMGLSFFGVGYENDTFISIVLLFMAMFLSSTFFESEGKFYNFFWASIVSAAVIGAVELIQIFFPGKLLSGGVLANVIGRWNDLSIFFGLALILSLIGLEQSPFQSSRARAIFWFLLAVSTFVVAAVNYNLIWAVIGVSALVILLYSFNHDEPSAEPGFFSIQNLKRIILRPSFAVVIASLIFFFSVNTVGSALGKYGLYQLEVRPSWQSTVEVAKQVMQKNLFFGSGPNSFSTAWASLKPDAVNSTIFWNTDFTVGFGRIPTYAVTLGLFGIIASALFLISLAYYGVKALLVSFDDPTNYFMTLISCVASLYLWSFSVVYSTDTVVLALTFVWTGIFLAVLARAGMVRNYEFSFFGRPSLNFISVLIIILLIISVISGGYLLSKKFLALYDFQGGLYAFNNSGNLDQVETSIKNAVSFDEQDIYYRSLTDLYLTKLKNLLNNQSALPKDALAKQFQIDLAEASASARRATEINGANYLNWVALGRVGETVLPLKNVVTGSYDLAFNSYSKALTLNPKNPNIYLSLAQLQVAVGSNTKATDYLNQAIAIKGNFTEALFLLSQIEASQGNLPSAIKKAEQAAMFSPDNAGILFQLGFMKYMSKDYSGAVDALKVATNIQSNYANAKYFLGLSYSRLGHVPEAIKEFEDVSALNPGNQEVQNILKNLRAGRGALDNVPPPKNEPKEPAKRSKLPVNEKQN